ncbi:hypothetical protein Prum_003800 [Phytohabitans rumicis]|uniref:Uncharacterized protein n=1 Tax=Phytohabitans rumicis TaxID=1076125 RepID=A0A6V8KVI9_9ACTN|nr:hypothetical protein Prum_003800 [Phytohabitans rumicis]
MDRPAQVRLSAVVMHHPSRRDRIPALLRGCVPLDVRVVTDPDPGGPRSPLRTAKLAWAAIAPGATHHLVLQDDAVPCAGFAEQVRAAVAQRPAHGIALHTDWLSPQNGYHARRAALVGAAWAPLSPTEWAPALGFLLPATAARELAGYLAAVPDEVKDDDQMIVRFCRGRALPTVATVPHLVDNANLPTLTTGHSGVHHATVFAGSRPPPVGHWNGEPMAERVLAERSQYRHAGEYVVQLHLSRCLVRLLRPGTGEPAGHEFCWYWHDWCHLAGVSAADVTAAASVARASVDAARLAGVPARLAGEVWAAGYLLGADAASVRDRVPGGRTPACERWRRAVVTSWVRSGLADADARALSAAGLAALVELGVEAVQHGERRGRPHDSADPADSAYRS